MYEHLELLLYIAKKQGLFGKLTSSTLKISKELSASQQTISRKLKEMEDLGLITRLASPSGLTISLDNKGREFLKQNYQELQKIFKINKTAINGTVESGIGEGGYYVSQNGYQEQFKEKIGWKAFPGTLNVKIDREELLLFMSNLEKIDIHSFKTKERTFGSIACYKIKLEKIDAAIVVPERTRHPDDLIEIIAPINLRKELALKDKDIVKIS